MDNIEGHDKDDVIHGGDGDDRVEGDKGNDRLYGDDGNDRIEGGDKDDLLDGGNGDDTLSGGDGDDSITGGKGADYFSCGDGDLDRILDYNGTEGDAEAIDCEIVTRSTFKRTDRTKSSRTGNKLDKRYYPRRKRGFSNYVCYVY